MKNHRHSARIAASPLTALLLCIGCGGGGGSDDPPARETDWDEMKWDEGEWSAVPVVPDFTRMA